MEKWTVGLSFSKIFALSSWEWSSINRTSNRALGKFCPPSASMSLARLWASSRKGMRMLKYFSQSTDTGSPENVLLR